LSGGLPRFVPLLKFFLSLSRSDEPSLFPPRSLISFNSVGLVLVSLGSSFLSPEGLHSSFCAPVSFVALLKGPLFPLSALGGPVLYSRHFSSSALLLSPVLHRPPRLAVPGLSIVLIFVFPHIFFFSSTCCCFDLSSYLNNLSPPPVTELRRWMSCCFSYSFSFGGTVFLQLPRFPSFSFYRHPFDGKQRVFPVPVMLHTNSFWLSLPRIPLCHWPDNRSVRPLRRCLRPSSRGRGFPPPLILNLSHLHLAHPLFYLNSSGCFFLWTSLFL